MFIEIPVKSRHSRPGDNVQVLGRSDYIYLSVSENVGRHDTADAGVNLTPAEARQIAAALIQAADAVDAEHAQGVQYKVGDRVRLVKLPPGTWARDAIKTDMEGSVVGISEGIFLPLRLDFGDGLTIFVDHRHIAPVTPEPAKEEK